ncbi:MAG: LuxR family transcriptional regulator [Raoultibacter sp.]
MGIKIPHITIKANYEDEGSSGEINLLSVGLGLHQAWIYAALFGESYIFGTPCVSNGLDFQDSLIFIVSAICHVACLCVGASTARRWRVVYRSKKTILIAMILTLCGTLIMPASTMLGSLGLYVEVFSGITTGIGSALFILFWGTAFSHSNLATIVNNTAVALVIGVCLYAIVLHQIPFPLAGILTACLPLGEAIILFILLPQIYPKDSNIPLFEPIKIRRRLLIVKLGLPVSVFGFALGSLRVVTLQTVVPALNMPYLLFMLLAAGFATVLILITALATSKHERLTFLFRPLVPFIAVAAFFIPLSGNKDLLFADTLLLIAYMCFEALMWIFLSELAHKFRLSPVFVFGLGHGALVGGSFLGSLIPYKSWALASNLPFGETTGAILTLLAMVIAYALLPGEKEISKLVILPTSAENSNNLSKKNASEKETSFKNQEEGKTRKTRFKICCEEIAGRYLLSQRETEVLFFLAKGHNSAYIQEKLYISEGTSKTHIRHIYKKLGVHTQQELMRMIEESWEPKNSGGV